VDGPTALTFCLYLAGENDVRDAHGLAARADYPRQRGRSYRTFNRVLEYTKVVATSFGGRLVDLRDASASQCASLKRNDIDADCLGLNPIE
jgi:hypothetical protein